MNVYDVSFCFEVVVWIEVWFFNLHLCLPLINYTGLQCNFDNFFSVGSCMALH